MLGDSNVAATIAVKDMAKAKSFYSEKLGLEVVKEDEAGVMFKSGDSKLFVYPSGFAGTNKATYAGWTVKDLKKVVEELKSKGVEFEKYEDLPGVDKVEGDIHFWGDFQSAWFTDPDGNILAIDNGYAG